MLIRVLKQVMRDEHHPGRHGESLTNQQCDPDASPNVIHHFGVGQEDTPNFH